MIRLLSQFGCLARNAGLRIVLGLCLCFSVGCKRAPETPASNAKNPLKTAAKNSTAVETNAVSVAVVIPKSVFSTNVNEGKDPFFPESTRRAHLLAERSAVRTSRPVQARSSYLKLNGLWPSKSRPLALINKTSLAPGETADISVMTVNAQNKPESIKVTVRCIEVRKESVLISIDGEPGTRELSLQSKL
jgi:hypothetical protein